MAEVLLRLGCSLVAWMVVYTHCIWLATLRLVDCGVAGDELWRVLLGFAPVAVGFAFLLPAVHPIAEVARILRWLAVPLLLLIPLAALPVVAALRVPGTRVEGFCGESPAGWHDWWGPVQIVTLTLVGWLALRVWKGSEPAE